MEARSFAGLPAITVSVNLTRRKGDTYHPCWSSQWSLTHRRGILTRDLLFKSVWTLHTGGGYLPSLLFESVKPYTGKGGERTLSSITQQTMQELAKHKSPLAGDFHWFTYEMLILSIGCFREISQGRKSELRKTSICLFMKY